MGIDIIKNWRISIHALREEGDLWIVGTMETTIRFLSTPSARRATAVPQAGRPGADISIHALREEGDEEPVEVPDISKIFLSTPSARRATRGR